MKVKGIVSLVISGLVVAALAVTYFLVLDTTAYPHEDKEVKTSTILKKAYFDSYKNLLGDKATTFKLSQDDLNQMALNKKKETGGADIPVGDIVDNFYVEVDKNNYNFYIETNLKIALSRIKMETTLEVQDDKYVFNINSLKLGSFPGFVLTTFGLLDKIELNTLFQRMNLSIEYDKANNRLVYTKENVKKDYFAHQKLAIGEPTGLMNALMSHMDLSFLGEGGPTYVCDFSKLVGNDALIDSSMENDHYIYYSDIKESIQNAYDYMKSDIVVNEVIETYLSALTYHFDSAINIDLSLEDSIKTTPLAELYEAHVDKEVATISEMSLSNVLRGSKIIGTY